jgi:tellurite resistance protein
MLCQMFAVALSDGKLDEAESKVLADLAVRLGMSTKDFTDVINNPSAYLKYRPSSLAEKKIWLNALIAMMLVDGEMDESEIKMITILGITMELSEDFILNHIKNTLKEIADNT